MNAPIYYIGGSKGGVGKSKFSFSLIDYLKERGQSVLLLETDNSNPDVFKAHQPHKNESLICKSINLDMAEGWIELVNHCEAYPGQARKLSLRINMETLLPLGVLALVCLLAYGSLLMWAGFCLGSGQAPNMTLILRMPSGILMGALCLAGSLLLGVHAGREFAEEGRGWRKKAIVALALLLLGGFVASQAL